MKLIILATLYCFVQLNNAAPIQAPTKNCLSETEKIELTKLENNLANQLSLLDSAAIQFGSSMDFISGSFTGITNSLVGALNSFSNHLAQLFPIKWPVAFPQPVPIHPIAVPFIPPVINPVPIIPPPAVYPAIIPPTDVPSPTVPSSVAPTDLPAPSTVPTNEEPKSVFNVADELVPKTVEKVKGILSETITQVLDLTSQLSKLHDGSGSRELLKTLQEQNSKTFRIINQSLFEVSSAAGLIVDETLSSAIIGIQMAVESIIHVAMEISNAARFNEIYVDNIEESVVDLKKLVVELKQIMNDALAKLVQGPVSFSKQVLYTLKETVHTAERVADSVSDSLIKWLTNLEGGNKVVAVNIDESKVEVF